MTKFNESVSTKKNGQKKDGCYIMPIECTKTGEILLCTYSSGRKTSHITDSFEELIQRIQKGHRHLYFLVRIAVLHT